VFPLKMLFSPIKIGSMESKNRCLMPPMGINYGNPDGTLSEKEIAFYTARAKGGFGIITTEIVAVDPLGKGIPLGPGLWDDKQMLGFEKLAKSVHVYGAKLVPQLHFAGNKATAEAIAGSQAMGPSPISYVPALGLPPTIETPIAKEMTKADIEHVVEAFGTAAGRAMAAGCDAVEIHGAHGYLFAQFMSPGENKRIDAYGGTVDGRLKLAIDVIDSIRSNVGREFPIIFKISGDEMYPGGRTIEETQLMAWLLAKAGVDCITVSRGSINASIHWILPPTGVAPATWVTEDTQLVKQAVDIPVCAVGRIIDPLMAEFILQSGKADLIAFGRASFADPDLPNKAAAGRLDDIRYCMGCQTCIDSLNLGGGVECAINPEMGREEEMLPIVAAPKPKKVLIAGSGPGGLEAARVAALRGHDVTLCEKSDRLGGQFWVASLPPGKQQLLHGLKWLAIQAEKAGAKIELGKELTPALVEELKPDVVIIATGGTPLIPADIPGIDKPKVVTANDVLTEKVRCGSKVAVIGGNMVGCEVADWLGYHRKDVTIIEMLEDIALDVSAFSKPFLMDRLTQSGVKAITSARVKAITDDGVVVVRNGKEETISGADNIVLALGTKPVNGLAEQLKGKVADIHVIGDAKEPRKAVNAVYEGAEVARKI